MRHIDNMELTLKIPEDVARALRLPAEEQERRLQIERWPVCYMRKGD